MAFDISGAGSGAMSGASAGSMLGPWGTLGGAIGGGLLGGFMGGGSSKTAKKLAREQMDRAEALQREFAQNGIRWRVEDAKRAGVHPLYALGGPGASFNPSSVSVGGDQPPDFSGIASAGQSVARAFDKTRTEQERLQHRMNLAQVEGQEIQNAYNAAQLRLLNQNGSGAPFPDHHSMYGGVGPVGPRSPIVVQSLDGSGPVTAASPVIPGQSGFGTYETKPPEIPTVIPGQPNFEAGAMPENRWVSAGSNAWTWLPQKDANLDEVTAPGGFSWVYRNSFLPMLPYRGGKDIPLPPKGPPKGAVGWRYHPLAGKLTPLYPGDPYLKRGGMYFVPDSDMRGK